MLLMWITRTLTARTLIWLAAIAVPVQGLWAASCGCSSSKASCQEERSKRCCCSVDKLRAGRCCAARRQATASHSCCSKSESGNESTCSCGIRCQCGKTNDQKPATPPAENTTAEKVSSDSTTSLSVETVVPMQFTQRYAVTSFDADSLAALDRCVSLCRFTL